MRCGRIGIGRRKINLSTVFAGQYVGVREVTEEVWLVSFLDYDPGFFDRELNKVEPMEMISRRAYGFRNFENYRLRVLTHCG